MLAVLPFFLVPLLAGFIGTPVGSRNAAIVLVWILWFPLLTVTLPITGRLWCFVCPIPVVSDLLARVNLGLRWRIDNTYPQSASFILISILSPLLLFFPVATSTILLFFMVLSALTGMLFTYHGRAGRVFCRYLCPLGGFISVYSNLASLMLRARDRRVCRECRDKTCIKGGERGVGCPWFLYPGGVRRNMHCGLCTECLRTCVNGNMAFKFGKPEWLLHRRDEALLTVVLLSGSLFYPAVFFGWFPALKAMAVFIEGPLLGYPLHPLRVAGFAFLFFSCLLALLAVFYLCIALLRHLSGCRRSVVELFTAYSSALVPLGLASWAGFAIYEFTLNGAYVLPVLSDPFGMGWDLFGTAGYHWRPWGMEALPYLLAGVFAGGVYGSVNEGLRVCRRCGVGRAAFLPFVGFVLSVFWVLVYLYLVG